MSGIGVAVGATALGVGGTLSAVGSVIGIGSSIAGIAGGGGGGGGAGGAGGGGGGVQANEQNFYKSNASNPFYGVNVSSKPETAMQTPVPKTPEMSVNESANSVNRGRVTTARETPTQADGVSDAKNDINGIWADRLSRFLDYNTRQLG